ncbi:MAG: phosphatase PAP2 family protein [Bacteroidales bacterium]|nr:phosphatase PAP2 family protein [Bacteroidales bacterium]
MLEILNSFDTDLFLFLNGKHNSFLDFIMYWASDKLIWLPFYIFLLYLLIRNYKKQTFLILIFIAVLIFFSDQISVFLKEYVQRLRPTHEPLISNSVHIVKDYIGGKYGFVSSHASNSFALAIFLIFFIHKKYRFFTVSILFWAILISYSRIYLGVHYPGDVFCGAILGSALGIIFAFSYSLIQKKLKQAN